MKTKLLILVLVLSLAAAGVTLAQDGIEHPRQVLSGGASGSAAGGVTLHATLGQPVVGSVTSGSGNVTLGQGFWHYTTKEYNIYLPCILK